MNAVKITIGWLTEVVEGENAIEIMDNLQRFQDFDCLLSMAFSNEPKSKLKEVQKLSEFVDKYHDETLTLDDFRNLEIHLKIGDIVCLGVAENEEEIALLKK